MVESYGAVESLVLSHNSVPLHELVSTESQEAITATTTDRQNTDDQGCNDSDDADVLNGESSKYEELDKRKKSMTRKSKKSTVNRTK